jgi:hypothetical protein
MRPSGTYIDKQTGKNKIVTTRYYLCRCECGKEKETTVGNLKNRAGCRHCGLSKPNPRYKHPMSMLWYSVVHHNYRKSDRGYKLKDKRSIRVCDRWLLSFDAFVKDAGEPPTPKHIFGRIDTDKGFTPDNCKWMTRSERGLTKKRSKELTSSNLSRQVGISKERVRQITNIAINNKEDELNNLIERIDYINTNTRIVFKPEAIEYFKKKKYIPQIKYIHKLEVIVKQYYLKGTEAETVAGQLNKPITSIKRYYKKFASAVPAEIPAGDSAREGK